MSRVSTTQASGAEQKGQKNASDSCSHQKTASENYFLRDIYNPPKNKDAEPRRLEETTQKTGRCMREVNKETRNGHFCLLFVEAGILQKEPVSNGRANGMWPFDACCPRRTRRMLREAADGQ